MKDLLAAVFERLARRLDSRGFSEVAAAFRDEGFSLASGVSVLTSTAATDTRHGMSIDDLKSTANLLRAKIKDIGHEVKALKDNVGAVLSRPGLDTANIDKGEAIANVQLAYRHLEDARMRLGKCIQALDGGVSIYDRPNEGNSQPA